MSAPRVSVVVPVHNVARHVGACVTSIATQTFSDFEVVVIDDGSSDDSGALARQAAAGDPRFHFVEQPNAGLSAARNRGLERAQGQFVVFVDSDDRLAATYLARLVQAIEDSGADWVACAILFCPPEGPGKPHDGLHGPGPHVPRAQQWHDLSDWRDIVCIYPSVWNKIYRRDLIGEIRFDEGLNYEDHAFFWRYAKRAGPLLRLPEPLYLSTQGRRGQITRDGSERTFEQFTVLDILAGILGDSQKPGGEVALARIATRLTFERAAAIGDRARRRRFLARARDWLAARSLQEDGALGVPAFWCDALSDQVPISVVVPTNADVRALAATLESLAAASLQEAEVLVVPDEGVCPPAEQAEAGLERLLARFPECRVVPGAHGIHEARNRGLRVAQGRAIVFLDAGDTLPPEALAGWHHRLRMAGADMGFARLRMGQSQTVHSGLHDPAGVQPSHLEAQNGFAPDPEEGLAIHAHPSAKIFDRGFLETHGIVFPPGLLSSSHMMLRSVLQAGKVVRLSGIAAGISTDRSCRTQWRRVCSADALYEAITAMQADPALKKLPQGWEGRLWARALWEKLNYADFHAPEERAAFMAEATRLSAQLPLGGALTLDPYIGPRIRKILGLQSGEVLSSGDA